MLQNFLIAILKNNIEYFEEIYFSFPTNGSGFFDRETFREKKSTSQNLSDFDPILSIITYAIQYPRVVAKISEL